MSSQFIENPFILFLYIILMGLLFGKRPRLTEVTNITNIEAYGLSFVGNGFVKLEIFSDIQVPLEQIRRDIAKNQDPVDLDFIVDTS